MARVVPFRSKAKMYDPFAENLPSGRVYGVTQNGAFMFGSITKDAAIESALVIPGDTDVTFVVERWMTKNETAVPESDQTYPDITGEWTIDNRKVIQNGTITDEGPVSEEWMSDINQTGKFFTTVRHTRDAEGTQEKQSSVIFLSPDEAYLTMRIQQLSCITSLTIQPWKQL